MGKGGKEERGGGGEGQEGKGEWRGVYAPPPSQIPGSAPDKCRGGLQKAASEVVTCKQTRP